MAVGGFARTKAIPNQEVEDMDRMAAHSFHQWAKEDGTLEVDNISPNAKLKPFVPEPYVPNR